MPLPLRDLMRVLAIAVSGSVSEAARRLHVAQPALSKTVQVVEGYLGVRLFDRGHAGMQPTPEAVDILARASAIRGELQRLERDVDAQRGHKPRRVVVGIVPVHSLNQMMRAIVQLLDREPTLDVGIEVGPFSRLMERLDAGAVDFTQIASTPSVPRQAPATPRQPYLAT